MTPISEDKLKYEISENNRKERDISDERYAPMEIKTGAYWVMGIVASSVVLAITAKLLGIIHL